MKLQKKLQAWRPLEVNRCVKIGGKWKRGQYGVVVEHLIGTPEEMISGLAKYGVRMDHSGNVADFCRYELIGLKRNGKPEIRRQ